MHFSPTSHPPQRPWHFDRLICLALFAFSLKVTPKLLQSMQIHCVHSPPWTLDEQDRAEGAGKRVHTNWSQYIIFKGFVSLFFSPRVFVLNLPGSPSYLHPADLPSFPCSPVGNMAAVFGGEVRRGAAGDFLHNGSSAALIFLCGVPLNSVSHLFRPWITLGLSSDL